MARSRTILIAGAGIAGLTTALALCRRGFPIVVLEAAKPLVDAGAGIQLPPNAVRVLRQLGLMEALRPHAVAPAAIHILHGRSGREIAAVPLGAAAEARYGAPYWVMHRADLQHALVQALEPEQQVVLRLGVTVADHAAGPQGIAVRGKTAAGVLVEERGAALIGADGLWSQVRRKLGHAAAPRFRGRLAWRATVPADTMAPAWRQPRTALWLGHNAHLVHYPVHGGAAINIVAITRDAEAVRGWSGEGARAILEARFRRWCAPARALLAGVPRWQTWSLYDLAPFQPWGHGAVTLAGDAAHPMLPFLAQGGAMAIEDAATLAASAAEDPAELATAFRAYEARRHVRTAQAARGAARNALAYHLPWPFAAARDQVMRSLGGEWLRARYDWLYDGPVE